MAGVRGGEGCQLMFGVVKATSGHYMEYCTPVLGGAGGGDRDRGSGAVEWSVRSIIDCRGTTYSTYTH